MRHLALFLSLLCLRNAVAQPSLADSVITQKSLQKTVAFLTNDSLKGRLTVAEGAGIAATFIAHQFKETGLAPSMSGSSYVDSFAVTYAGKKRFGKNLVAVLPGDIGQDTMVIFSAHYDHIGQGPDLPDNKGYTHQDDIFNGANDNATGVAALLELAKYYKAQHSNKYKLVFVAFSGEEMGMLGSEHLSKKLKPGLIKAVINLEMLGKPEADNCFIVSFNNSAIKNKLNRYLSKYQQAEEKAFFINDPYLDEGLSQRSDHYPFARKNKNAFTIMGSSPVNEYYHSVGDEYETIEFDFLLKATKKIALACEQFIR